jgi:hypothetical protein
MKTAINALILILMFALTGCVMMDQAVEVRNGSSNMIGAVKLTSSHGFNSGFGRLMPGAQSTVGGYKTIRRGDTCHLSWTDSAGKHHEVTLDLSKEKELPMGYDGNLSFVVNTNGTVSVKPRD